MNIQESVTLRRDEILGIGNKIFSNPETGFKEFKTAELVMEKFDSIRRQLEYAGSGCISVNISKLDDIPGVKMSFDTGKEGPGLAVIGELDAIICREHPMADKNTGAMHACGHDAQVAAMIGAAMALADSGILEEISGKIHFIAVPAEEYIEIEYRMGLRNEGKIRYLGGKPEFLHRGLFDNVDICIKIHAGGGDKKLYPGYLTQNGCLIKHVKYIGKASHSGGAPYAGINALYAANLGLMAINSIRETFKEEDYIKVHPIITKGGDVVNVIPCEVRIETFIRGKTVSAIMEANHRVDKALVGGTISMGAKVEIEDIPGYMPGDYDNGLKPLACKVMKELVGEENVGPPGKHSAASSDMGDLSSLMPVIEASVSKIKRGHSEEYEILDAENLYITGTRFLAAMIAELMSNNAEEARKIVDNYKPLFKSKEKYFAFADSLFKKKVYDEGDLFK